MSRIWENANDTVGQIAAGLIPMYHTDLATARITYVFVDKASKKGGKPVLVKVKRVTGFNEWLMESDFLVEVPLDIWNELSESQRTAYVDHALEYCAGEEGDDGSMKWTMRETDIHEFSTILDRHGAWHEGLVGFVSVAKKIHLDLEEETEESLNDETESGTEE